MAKGLYIVNRHRGTKTPMAHNLTGRYAIMLDAVDRAGYEIQVLVCTGKEIELCLFHPETGTDLIFDLIPENELQSKFIPLLETAYEIATA